MPGGLRLLPLDDSTDDRVLILQHLPCEFPALQVMEITE